MHTFSKDLPLEDRLNLGQQLPQQQSGDILLELSEPVRETLIREMHIDALITATKNLEADEIADLVPNLPDSAVDQILQSLLPQQRAQLEDAMS